MAFNILAGTQYVQQQGEEGRQRGQGQFAAKLLGEAYNSTGAARQDALGRLAGRQPQVAMAADQQFRQQDAQMTEEAFARLQTHAKMIQSVPSEQRAQVWAQIQPRIAQELPEYAQYLPSQWDEAAVMPVVEQLASLGGGETNQPTVRSSFVGADGQMYSILSDGSVKNQGVGADRKLQFTDVAGVGPQVVDLRNATAQAVTAGGAPQGAPQARPASTFAFTPAPEAAGDPDADAFAKLPPDQQAVAAGLLQQGQDFNIQNGRVVPSGMRGGQPMNQPAANRQPTLDRIPIGEVGGGAIGAPAWVRPASGGRGDAGVVSQLSPQEVAQLGLPEGTVAQRGPDGKVSTLFTPDAGSRKAAREAATKLPRVDAAVRRVDRLASAIETIAGGFFDGGPVDQKVLQYSPQGQEVTQAAASLLPELTALTRVPGVGSQSDLETRLANLQLPSLEFPPEVNRRALAELRTFMADLAEVYRGMAEGNGTQPAKAAPEDDEDSLIGKYL